jgi:CRISPR type I-E-associated protein CasB/Cse2
MTTDEQKVGGWRDANVIAMYQHLGRVFGRIDQDSGTRSLLRRRVTDLDAVDLYAVIYPGIPSELTGDGFPTEWELAIRDASCLYASASKSGWSAHQSARAGEEPTEGYVPASIGSSLKKVALSRGKAPEDDTMVISCLNKLVTSTSRSDLVTALERATSLLSSYQIKVDYLRLANDLRSLYRGYSFDGSQYPVRHKWSSEYLTSSRHEEASGRNESTSESTE